jgi:hypothetical protein
LVARLILLDVRRFGETLRGCVWWWRVALVQEGDDLRREVYAGIPKQHLLQHDLLAGLGGGLG